MCKHNVNSCQQFIHDCLECNPNILLYNVLKLCLILQTASESNFLIYPDYYICISLKKIDFIITHAESYIYTSQTIISRHCG